MSKKILIDIDLTICDVTGDWREYLVERYGSYNFNHWEHEAHCANGLVDYCIANYVNPSMFPDDKSKLDFWRQEDLYDNVELFDNCKDVINKLHDRGDTIIFVSYCKAKHLQSKWELLRRNFPWVEGSPTGGFIATKRKEFVYTDIIIDDRHSFLQVHPAPIKIKVATPYTQCTELTKEHITLDNWKQIGEYLL
jgi:5'(3')-deoxyribonucleotidase